MLVTVSFPTGQKYNQWDTKQFGYQHSSKDILFGKRKKCIQVWNDMRMS